MKDYYELMKMGYDEADLLVGTEGNFNPSDKYKIIQLDEHFEFAFSTKYSVIKVWNLDYGKKNCNKKTLGVLVPGVDDFNFRALFYESEKLNLSILEELMFNWVDRYSCRYINCHALEDYCLYNESYDIDWN